ncbi:MAG: hypothetical protein ABJN34_09475 [Litoreibacter sp.]|uniref:hypothetical protein n=1 Tax=Litoreibacter sp. TaxID=1969459 RepID=UPI00329A58D9
MSLQQIDTMIDFAITQISGSPEGYRAVVRNLTKEWPDVTGAQIVFVLVSAANAIEQVFEASPDPKTEVQQTFRMAALLASDLFALQQRDNFAPSGRDLSAYWNENDRFFLDL